MADQEIKNENNFNELEEELDIEGTYPAETVEKISKQRFIYSIIGLVGGLLCILGGIILFILGISGSISWTTSLLGAKSELIDAAPGGLLFIIGVFVIFITRYKIKIKR